MPGSPQVALVSVGELFGGVERHLLGMCAWLGREGVDPLLVLFHDRELARQARDLGVDPVILEGRGSFDLALPKRLAELLAQRRVDVVHAHGYRAVVNAALARRHHRFGLVRTVHGLVEPARPLTPTWLKAHLYDRLETIASNRARATVCSVTDDLRRRRAGHGAVADRWHTVHNGIDALPAGPYPRPVDLPGGEFHFAAVGRVSPVKGLETVLQVMRRLPAERPVVLNVIGTGPSTPGLQRLAAELELGDRVRFLGFRDNIYDYLAHVDVLVMPSRHEGLPYTILETMSLGTAIIASRVGGLAEILDDGRTGLLVEPGDVAGWLAAMTRLVAEPRTVAALGAAGRAEQARAFTLESMGQAYERIYTETLERLNADG